MTTFDNPATTMKDVPASELARHSRRLVSIDMTTTLDQALQLLHKDNILSVPVFDFWNNKWVGILTVQDILSYIAFKDFENGEVAETFDNGVKPAGNVIRDRGAQLPIAAITDSVADVLEPLCKEVHRMLVRLPVAPGSDDDKESELRLITQTDVLRCAVLLEDAADWTATLEDLGLVKGGDIVTITPEATALTGFQRMCQHDINAVPVVSEEGKLIAVLSASDLRGLTSNLIQRVKMPVLDFLKESRRGHVRRPITASRNASLQEAVNKIMWGRVHRVIIVDDDQKPVGVVTSTDVIRHFYNHMQSTAN